MILFRKSFSPKFYSFMSLHHIIAMGCMIVAILLIRFEVVDTAHGHEFSVMGALWNLCSPVNQAFFCVKWSRKWPLDMQIRLTIISRSCTYIPCLAAYVLLIYHWCTWHLIERESALFITLFSPCLFFNIFDTRSTILTVKSLYRELNAAKEPVPLTSTPVDLAVKK